MLRKSQDKNISEGTETLVYITLVNKSTSSKTLESFSEADIYSVLFSIIKIRHFKLIIV